MNRREKLYKALHSIGFAVDDLRELYKDSSVCEEIVVELMLANAVQAQSRLTRIVEEYESREAEARDD